MVRTTNIEVDYLRVNLDQSHDLFLVFLPLITLYLDARVLLIQHVLHLLVEILHKLKIFFQLLLNCLELESFRFKVQVHVRDVLCEDFLKLSHA